MNEDVIKEGVIKSAGEICQLGIIDWNRTNGYWNNDTSLAIQAITNWLANRAYYTILHLDIRGYPERDDWPGWTHTTRHEIIGKMYWNFFHYESPPGRLAFSDEPDFYGTLEPPVVDQTVRFYGDIGRVSVSAFAFTLPKLRKHDIWISIVTPTKQVVIEALDDFQERFSKRWLKNV